MKNFSLNVNKVTIFITVATLFFTFFGELLPLSPKLETAIVGFIGAVGALIKTYQAVPTKDETPKDPPAAGGSATQTVTRLIFGATLLVLLAACASSAKPASCAPDTDLAEESARFQATVLAACDHSVPLSQCAAYPALRADHDARLEGFIQSCRK